MRRAFAYVAAVNLLNLAGTLFDNDDTGHHGFGGLYRWMNVEEGFSEAKKTRRPLMLLVHKLGCPACANLRPKFASSLKVLDLSQYFVMVNVESRAEQPLPDEFVPDGTYVPRILFFSPDGKLLREIINQDPERDPNAKYHYWSIPQIVDSMLRVLGKFPQPPNVEYLKENRNPVIGIS